MSSEEGEEEEVAPRQRGRGRRRRRQEECEPDSEAEAQPRKKAKGRAAAEESEGEESDGSGSDEEEEEEEEEGGRAARAKPAPRRLPRFVPPPPEEPRSRGDMLSLLFACPALIGGCWLAGKGHGGWRRRAAGQGGCACRCVAFLPRPSHTAALPCAPASRP